MCRNILFSFSMKKRIAVMIIVLCTSFAQAGNRDAADEIFDEPKVSGWTQILIGFVEFLAASSVYPGLSNEAKLVKTTELNLALAEDLPTSEAERKAKIDALLHNPNNFDFDMDIGNEYELKKKAAHRLEKLRSAIIVSEADRAKAISKASTEVGKAREAALKAAQAKGLISKTVKIARIGGSVLLVGDVLARIYIWNAMDANPTLSPAGTYLYHQLTEE